MYFCWSISTASNVIPVNVPLIGKIDCFVTRFDPSTLLQAPRTFLGPEIEAPGIRDARPPSPPPFLRESQNRQRESERSGNPEEISKKRFLRNRRPRRSRVRHLRHRWRPLPVRSGTRTGAWRHLAGLPASRRLVCPQVVLGEDTVEGREGRTTMNTE